MNHNQQQRVWEALLAVHSLDELDGDLRREADAMLSESAEFAAAWNRVQQFDRDVVRALSVDQHDASRLLDLVSRVSLSLDESARRQEFDSVHNEVDLAGPVTDESRELWLATREFDSIVGHELANVDVPDGLQSRLLASLATREALATSEPATSESATSESATSESATSESATVSATPTAATATAGESDLVVLVQRNDRRRWLAVGASVVAASVLAIIYVATGDPPVKMGSAEALAASCLEVLGRPDELNWSANTERMPWVMPEKAEGRVAESEAVFFRRQQPGQDVYLVRVTHDLAQKIQQRLPFRDVAASGGWHVGSWSDGKHVFFACSRDRETLEMFRENINAI